MTKIFILFAFITSVFATYGQDECANAVTLTPGASCVNTTGSFSGMTISTTAPACAPSASQDLWYKFTATDSTMRISLSAQSSLNHGFEIVQGGCGGTVLQCVNNNSSGVSEGYFNYNFIPGQLYYVRVFNVSGSPSTLTFGICIQNNPVPANDRCVNATTLTPSAACNYTTGTFSGAMMNGGVPSCAPSASQDVWYKFVATDSTMRISLSAETSLNHGFEIIQGSCNDPVMQCVNNNSFGVSEGYFYYNFIPGQTYYVRVFNVSGSLSILTFGICIQNNPVPANDRCVNATTLTPGTACNYTIGTFSGAMMNGGVPSCAPSASQDVWYKFIATDSTMRISLSAETSLNHGFEIIEGSCNGPVMQCVNNNSFGVSEGYFYYNFIPGQTYYVRVFNTSGSLSILTFGICIQNNPVPANDRCVNATTLTPGTACNYTIGTFSGAMMNGGVPSCAPSASQDVWYKFIATDSTMRISLSAETSLNHGFEVIQGSCNGPVMQCVNNNSFGLSEGYFYYDFIPGQTYYVRVFNTTASLSILTFGICIQNYSVPANDRCVNATTLTPGTACNYTIGTFSGAMMNGGVPSCASSASQDVWYKFVATDSTMRISLSAEASLNHGFEVVQGSCNGSVMQCVNSNSFGLSEGYFNYNFIPGQTYYVRVFNASASLSTLTFGICIQNYPVPVNDLCVNATTLTPGTTCNYTYGTFSGAMMNGGTPSCASSASQDVWYKFTATDSTMSIGLEAVSNLNHGFEIIQGSCNGPVVQCVNSNSSGLSENYFNYNFIPGQVYYVRVFNTSASLNALTFGICIRKYPTPVNDLCANAIELTPNNSCNTISGTFSGAMLNGNTPSCAPSISQDVWYKFTATAANMSIQLGAVTGLNHGFQVLEGSCNGAEILCRNQNGSGLSESATMTTLTIGQTYYVRVLNTVSGLNTGTFTICLIGTPPSACTPSVAINASATTICQGESVVFNATPTHGGASPSYQWKVNGGNVGTNSSSYTTTTLTNGSIVTCVMVSNAACASPTSVTSNAITMTVSASVTPAFTQIPAICSGGSITLPTTSNNGINGTWSPVVNNTATTTYTFTPNSGQGQCVLNAAMTVTVNNATTPTFNQVSAICSGGSFTLPTTSTNGINGSWSPAVNNTATTTYTFTPNAGQCASATTMTVTVNSTSTTPTFNQVPAICSGGSFTLPTTSTNGINGTWSPAINNTATTMYTFTPNAGQCAVTTTMTVTVNTASVTPAFTQIPAICSGESFILPTTSTNVISGTWSPAANNTATTTYTFTPNAGQCGLTTTMTVTVNNSVTPTFNQIPAICSGGSFTLPTTSTNGISGTWSPAVNNTATTTYTFTATSGQCVTSATMTVVVNSVNAGTTVQGNTITASATGATYHWINCADNQPINGATNASFTPTQNGSYAVVVTQNGCSATSSCVIISTVGLEALTQNGWNVYPNPASDQLFIEVNEAVEIAIIDMTGKTVQQADLKSGNNIIQVSSLTPGVYFIKSTYGANVKFVKN
ncbi:hypothetical protein D3C87_25790 [compost metagenome]